MIKQNDEIIHDEKVKRLT